MAHVIFSIAAFGLGILFGAGFAVSIARVTGHGQVARRIEGAFSSVAWLFKLGDDGDPHRHRAMDGHSWS